MSVYHTPFCSRGFDQVMWKNLLVHLMVKDEKNGNCYRAGISVSRIGSEKAAEYKSIY